MQSSLKNNLQKIAQRKIVNINDYQKVDIVANDHTVEQIKKICQRTGLTISQVIEGIIRTALEDKNLTAVSGNS
ncbi:hypothetical protein Dtox_0008 [Desulfofarcimen acetoxidans DSM 771]|uniref:Uncharacterized protein n=1 Tax=Desulfofarcimen acetoxidans (strain ATCC 49208 / DSM 771 / KCTC 5769 / VKM B-1644 / 5575) TaxID=485916 RepID=C8VVA4_DESAS|nr:hypothetical protein [Desulfofarcimen acetoxidans]ACV60973.1 hypothetical protein Dtox_0008 [Desulfofarcimen acetoxidans DSM 771]